MDTSTSALSKNAQKRLLKEKRFAETRELWKAKQKLKKKESRERKKGLCIPKPVLSDVQKDPSGQLIIDLAFEGLMTDKVQAFEPTSTIRKCKV